MSKPTSFNIMINEAQRLALIEVLKAADPKFTKEDAPLDFWIGMLEDLPNVDTGETYENQPGSKSRMLNGFCL